MTVDGLTPWVLPKAQKSGKTVIPFISSHWHNKLHRHYTEGYAIGGYKHTYEWWRHDMQKFLRINSELITKYQWLHCPKDTEMAFHEMCYETNCQQYFVCKINAKLYLPLNRKRNLSGKFSVIFWKFLKTFAKKKTNFSCKCFKRWSSTGRKDRMGCYKNNWDW